MDHSRLEQQTVETTQKLNHQSEVRARIVRIYQDVEWLKSNIGSYLYSHSSQTLLRHERLQLANLLDELSEHLQKSTLAPF